MYTVMSGMLLQCILCIVNITDVVIQFEDSEPRTVSLDTTPVESSVELSCTVVNQGSYTWQWSFKGVTLTQPDTLSDATRTSTITISSLSADDAGVYQCQASVGSQSRAQSITLSLNGG